MKKLFVLVALLVIILAFTACGARTCHYCNKPISGDALSGNGRYYCSYDCYMNELFSGK